jgi:UDP-N-acetylglucosamine--N-acetylmuramyl-(pentapeptide) pyrophosphoryl-undecaprenol N-acetylglucosamine transferase
MSRVRWIVAGGGTGGHVTLALALAERIAECGDRVLCVGGRHGLEGRLVPAAGFDLETLPASQVMGRGPLGRLRGLWDVARGALAARGVLRRFDPQIVLSVGGYAAVPAVAAAASRRTPLALVEPNAIPGRANRMTGRFAKRVFLAFDDAAPAFRAETVRMLGAPLRRALVEAFASPEPRRIPTPPVRLLVFGGSQGARQINDALLAALPSLDPGAIEVAHQTGEADRPRVAEAYAGSGIRADVFAFDPDMPRRYRWADLALCRAGAITVAELALAGLPALLVPYPHAADDHQTANARSLDRAGAARLLDPHTLDGKVLGDALGALLAEPERLADMGRRARELARPQAARDIVEECRALVAPGMRNPQSDPGRRPVGVEPAPAAAASTARAEGSAAPGTDGVD